MSTTSWEFWRLTRITDGVVEWLAASRPDARAAIDREKVWTLIPQRIEFVANWYVTEDHWTAAGENAWIHEQIDVTEARRVALEAPEVAAKVIARIARPQTFLTLDQID